jgi:hypothetical protein
VPVLGRILPWLGVVALVVAAVVTAGWGDGPGSPQPSRDRSSFPSVTPSGTPVADPTSLSFAQAHSLTRNVVLPRRALPGDFVRVEGPHDGYRLTSASLDLCGGSFESESYRLAARRVTYRSRDRQSRVESVVVVYERGHADQALAELEATAPRCTRPVRPSAREQPDTLALRVRRTGPARTVRRDLVVERRGDVLALLQVDGRQGYLTLDLARRLGNRLEAQLP